MAELIAPLLLFVAAVVAALRLPVWRAGIGPVLELLTMAAILELNARAVIPETWLPPSHVLIIVITYVLLRAHRILGALPSASSEAAPEGTTSGTPRWQAFLITQARLDRRSVASSLHLFPFATFVLLPTLMSGTYVAREAEIGLGLLFGLMALTSSRLAVVLLIISLSSAFVGSWDVAST